ncbi:MAG: hypothetical protein Q8L39_10615 [Burkholderiales bacterium]|nr:hypothetical protein [Burkholderiales bacterium]
MNPKDFIQARRDALMIRAGLLTAADPIVHPEAGALAAGGGNLIAEMAKFCADVATQTRSPGAAGRGPSAGFSRSDFGSALADVLRTAAFVRMAANMQHEQLCTRLDVTSFVPRMFPMVAIDSSLALVNELGEFVESVLASSGGLSAQLKTYGRDVLVSRQVLLTDDISLVAGAFANFGGAAARREARLVYGLIESNPALADGELMFAAGHGNVLAAALDESNLGVAMGMLRSLPDPFGEKSNFDAAVLTVEGRLEAAARRIVKDAGLDLEVVASPWLAVGRWYLQPSPDIAPVIGLLRLAGSKYPARIEPKSDDLSRDGSLFGVRADTGVVGLGRTAIRGGA